MDRDATFSVDGEGTVEILLGGPSEAVPGD